MARRILRPRAIVAVAALLVFVIALVALESGMRWAVAAGAVGVLLIVALSLDADNGPRVGRESHGGYGPGGAGGWGGDGGGGGHGGGWGGDGGGGGGDGGGGGGDGGGGG